MNESTQKFLSHFINYVLVAIQDVIPEGKKAKIAPTTLEDSKIFNSIKRKRCISFSPNGDYSLAKDRKQISAKNIYAFVVDIESKNKTRESYGLEPTLIVKTGRGYHAYFLLDTPIPYKKEGKSRTDTAIKLNKICEGDIQVADISKVLRLPGYKYWKDNKGEIEVELLKDDGPKYDFYDFVSNINNIYDDYSSDFIKQEGYIKENNFKAKIRNQYSKMFDDISQVDVASVLEDLFPQYEVQTNGDIIENGKGTHGYKMHKTLNFVNSLSPHSERPRGGPYSVAKSKFGSTSEVIQYFKDKWGISVKDDVVTSIKTKAPIQEKVDEKREHIVGQNCGIFINYDVLTTDYYIGDKEGQFFNGVIDILGYVEIDDIEFRILEVKRAGYNNKIFLLKPFGTLGDFHKQLMAQGVVVGDERAVLRLFMQHITGLKEEYYFIDKLGLQEIGGRLHYIYKGGLYVDKKNKLYVSIKELEGMQIGPVKEILTPTEEVFQDYIKVLGEAYNLEVSLILFLGVVLGYNSFFFRNGQHQLPSTFIIGHSQSGKTRSRELQMSNGFGSSFKMSAAVRPFSYEKLAKHYLALPVEEYRNAALGNYKEAIEGIIRSIYDGGMITKGNAQQKLNKYELNCSRVFDGQTCPTDDATLTRMIIVQAKPGHKGKLESYSDLSYILPYVLGIFENQEDFELFMDEVMRTLSYFEKSIKLKRDNSRMLYNYSLLIILARRLGLGQYENIIMANMKAQDYFLAEDDTKTTYATVMNLQQLNQFEVWLHDGGIVIDVIEEAIRYGINVPDLKGQIKVINNTYKPGDDKLVGMSAFISLDVIFNTPSLWGMFLKSLGAIKWGNRNNLTKGQISSIRALISFIETNYPGDDLLGDLRYDLSKGNLDKKPCEVPRDIDKDF